MGYDKPDAYNQPESFGLHIVEEHERSGLSYSFNMVVLWQHDETGEYYWAADSGDSRLVPFEWATDLSTLTRGAYGYTEAVKVLQS